MATIGVDYMIKTEQHYGKLTKIQLWDTAGMSLVNIYLYY
jgi:GTPase SAR1 family protein